MNVCDGLQDNPDISGLGVRLSFYLQAFLTVVLAHLPDSDVSASYWSMTITAFALFISAIALYAQNNLTLYGAILASVLLYMHAYAAVYSVFAAMPHVGPRLSAPLPDGTTPREIEREWWMQRLSALPVVSIATISAMFIWVRAPSFGWRPECNHQTLFTFFGIWLLATGAGRIVALVLSSGHCFPLVMGVLSCTDFLIWDIRTPATYTHHSGVRIPIGRLRKRVERRLHELDELEKQKALRLPPRNPVLRALHSVSEAYWAFLRDKRHLAFVLYFGVMVVCFIVIMELTIKANKGLIQNASSDNTWTLGQIFPVIMLAVPLTSLVKWIKFYLPTRSPAHTLNSAATENVSLEEHPKAPIDPLSYVIFTTW